jgi:hypothetical protein
VNYLVKIYIKNMKSIKELLAELTPAEREALKNESMEDEAIASADLAD